MQTPEDIRRRLAMGIVEYLDKAVAESHVSTDGAESLEIAKQCISDAFGIDAEDQDQARALSLKPMSLDKVFEVYLKTQAKLGSSGNDNSNTAGTSTSTSTSAEAAGPASSASANAISEEDRQRADELKAEGNRLITSKNFAGAIDAYTKAIQLVADNAVYFGNRSAAYSQNGDHEKAVVDATKALAIEPTYIKGFSRLGHAYFGMGKFAEAADAYTKGLELDPDNSVMKSALQTAKSKAGLAGDVAMAEAASESRSASASPESGGAAGGFDLASLMSNPALMSMAQNMMANGGLEQLMSNPAVSRLAENYRSTGQMPNISDMMSNPDLVNMARNFSGNASGADSGSAGAGAGGNPLASLMNNPNLMNMAQQFMRGNQANNNSSNNNNGDSNNSSGNGPQQ
ncbi:Small glutamine-rich tetratricopeptide repeat-containing protein 2 [Coemansia spiralis]|uniref:Small glutamine-rich tetratricopeptide repeat-containing protein 2 n=1 Tax=Coemansia spiralis TaxID=417178 RepID=A0A9W8G2Z7_9FUNG|nr:hypothetical protein BX070DRAFT_218379 [Coemansia spiralis]KAJ2672549.1 Small glutamine-rich tetratricopeptide repeat-containing protein 2 [Coemansia spiralis]